MRLNLEATLFVVHSNSNSTGSTAHRGSYIHDGFLNDYYSGYRSEEEVSVVVCSVFG